LADEKWNGAAYVTPDWAGSMASVSRDKTTRVFVELSAAMSGAALREIEVSVTRFAIDARTLLHEQQTPTNLLRVAELFRCHGLLYLINLLPRYSHA